MFPEFTGFEVMKPPRSLKKNIGPISIVKIKEEISTPNKHLSAFGVLEPNILC